MDPSTHGCVRCGYEETDESLAFARGHIDYAAAEDVHGSEELHAKWAQSETSASKLSGDRKEACRVLGTRRISQKLIYGRLEFRGRCRF
nr:hypothetical protein GCM10023233_10610 [Brevibacterium otitidis]